MHRVPIPSLTLFITNPPLAPNRYSLRMRIIAGELRSRRLQAPRGLHTRPTSDRLRETLFSVLGPRIEGARFADLYAGSGAVGLEALSRGAAFVWFAEKAPPALAAIRANVAAFQITDRYAIEDRGVARLLQKGLAADIVFLDPPYDAEEEYRSTLQAVGRTDQPILVVAEHASRQPLPLTFGRLQRTRLLEQGDAALSFYEVAAS